MRISFVPPTTTQHASQRGGTFLGLILGVLIGLFAALAVAVYVTKVPIPFAPKSSQVEGSVQDEIEKNKAWNPNAGLVGGKVDMGQTVQIAAYTPAPEATDTQALTPTPVKKKTPEAEEQSPAKASPSLAPETKTDAKTSDDPLADLVKRKTVVQQGDVSTDEVVAKAEPFIYYVQIGAFVNKSEADSQKAKLAFMGIEASVQQVMVQEKTWYRVRLGAFSREEAERIRDNLKKDSIEANIVK